MHVDATFLRWEEKVCFENSAEWVGKSLDIYHRANKKASFVLYRFQSTVNYQGSCMVNTAVYHCLKASDFSIANLDKLYSVTKILCYLLMSYPSDATCFQF